MAENFYITGGTLPGDAVSYVGRTADRELLNAVQQGEYCYVLTSRQMGKSSLMIRTAARLRLAGVRVAVLDLTAIGQNLSPEQWYGGLLRRLGRQLDSSGELEEALDNFWEENAKIGPLQRWMSALENLVLRHGNTTGSVSPVPLVIFVDEIDAVRSLRFPSDEFFVGIRECFNRRAQDSAFNALTFCLIGVATPADLISDARISPFNIGRRIHLMDFSAEEAQSLAQGLGGSRNTLSRVLFWTGGHPYLTQRLCSAIAESQHRPTPRQVDDLCGRLFLSKAAQEGDDNLSFVRTRLLNSGVELAGLLDLYGRIRSSKSVLDDETNPLCAVLRLSGVVKAQDGRLTVRNRIYEQVFDARWVQAHMPGEELRRQRTAFRHGLIRAGAIGVVVLTIMGLLAASALIQADHARVALGASTLSEQRLRLAVGRTEQAKKALEKALKTATSERRRADASAYNATAQARLAAAKAKAAREARTRAEFAQARATASARAERYQAALARAAGKRERRAAMQALAVLSQSQADRGVRLLEDGDTTGLLDLVEATRNAVGNPVLLASRRRLWSHWYDEYSPRLRGLIDVGGLPASVRYGGDGKLLAVALLDGRIGLWDSETGRRRGDWLQVGSDATPLMDRPRGAVTLSFSSDHRYLAAGTRNLVRIWDCHSTKLTREVRHPGLAAFALLPGTHVGGAFRLLTIGQTDGESNSATGLCVNLWELPTGRQVGNSIPLADVSQLVGQSVPFAAPMVVSADGKIAAAIQSDFRVHFWDTENGRKLGAANVSEGRAMGTYAIGPGGTQLALSGQNQVELTDADQEKELRLAQSMCSSLCFSPDGGILAGGSVDGTTRLWNARDGKPLGMPMRQEGFIVGLDFSPDGRRLATAAYDGTVAIWDADVTRAPGVPVPGSNGTRVLGYSHGGKTLVLQSDSTPAQGGPSQSRPGIQLWDPVVGKFKRSIAAVDLNGRSEDGRYLAVAESQLFAGARPGEPEHRGYGIRVVESATGNRLGPWLNHGSDAPWRASFDRTNKYLATTTLELVLRIWDIRSGKLLHGPYRRQPRFILGELVGNYRGSEPFSPDGACFVYSAPDFSWRIVDLKTGIERGDPMSHDKAAVSELDFRFSPDGRTLATSTGNSVYVWDVRTTRRRYAPLLRGSMSLAPSFSPDGNTLAVSRNSQSSGRFSASLSLFEALTGRPIGKSIISTTMGPPIFARRGFRMAVSTGIGTIGMYDWRTGTPLGAPLRLGGFGLPVEFSADGGLLLTHSLDNSCALWDTSCGLRCGRPLQLGQDATIARPGTGAALSPGAEQLSYIAPGGQARTRFFRTGPMPISEMERRTWAVAGGRLDQQGNLERIAGRRWWRLKEQMARLDANRIHEPDQDPISARVPSKQAVVVREYPRRPAEADSGNVDLTPFYNAMLTENWHLGVPNNDLARLPRGLQSLGGVRFDVRGVIQLRGRALSGLGNRFPKQALGIKVGRPCRRFHLLHSTAWTDVPGTQIGAVVVHYADGHKWETPIVYGRDVRDWWVGSDRIDEKLNIAWRGSNGASPSPDSIRLYKTTIFSPLSSEPVDRIDYLSTGSNSSPFLIAITVE